MMNYVCEEGTIPEIIKELPPAKQKSNILPTDITQRHYVFEENKYMIEEE